MSLKRKGAELAARFGEEAGDAITSALRGLRVKDKQTPLSEELVGRVEQRAMERVDPPEGVPASAIAVVTPETARRIAAVAQEGVKKGGHMWYDTRPILSAFQEELGDDAGQEAFGRFMDYVSVTSPRSRVDANIRRGSLFYSMDRQGLDPSITTNADMPPGYGHLAHKSHVKSAADLRGGGHFSSLSRPKTSSFAENLKLNLVPVTVDTHNVTSLTGAKRSPKANEYAYFEAFQQEIADRMGIDPGQFQAALWTADDTGVANVRNFTELFDEAVTKTAARNKDTKQGTLSKFIRGEVPLYSLLAGTTLGSFLPAEEAEAGTVSSILRMSDDARSLVAGARARYAERRAEAVEFDEPSPLEDPELMAMEREHLARQLADVRDPRQRAEVAAQIIALREEGGDVPNEMVGAALSVLRDTDAAQGAGAAGVGGRTTRELEDEAMIRHLERRIAQNPAQTLPERAQLQRDQRELAAISRRVFEGGAATPGALGASAGVGMAATISIDPEVEAEIDRRMTGRVRGGQYEKRRQAREGRYASLRQTLLGGLEEVTANLSNAFRPAEVARTLETPQRGLLGLGAGGVALAQGQGPQSALREAARVAQQPVDETAYEVGGAVTDATGSPVLGTVANVATQAFSPL